MKRVIFVQLPTPRFSFQEPPTNIPIAAGFLMSALNRGGSRSFHWEVLEPEIVDVLADRALAAEVLRRDPRILALTLYVWNVERSLFLASNVKRRSPGTVVLVGGPEITPDNRWVLEHPAVDVAVFGEGESRISHVLRAASTRCGLQSIPGIASKDRKGKVLLNSESPEPWNLDACSYPYLDGKIAPSRDGTLFLETMRGCPFKCRYCYYHKAFSSMRFYPDDCLEKLLDFAYAADSPVREIYLMDPTFNVRKGFRRLLRSMIKRRKNGTRPKLHTELRADLLEAQDVALFKEAGLASAEIGLQSITPEALLAAGRKGDPEKIAAGVDLLKKAGIEVTTGIILGLPEDTPQGFSRTLKWLKKKDAYSVVHPFVLSVLPGTDFRAQAEALGLQYNPRPPYFVQSTPTFPGDKFRTALLECERVFDMEMDYISPPSLVDCGPGVLSSADSAAYISKWIVEMGTDLWRENLSLVIDKATDPFTLWFKGVYDEQSMIFLLSEFTNANPHAVVHVVLELNEPPATDFFEAALQSAANPDLFLNRYYEPLYGAGEVININFYVILPDPGNGDAKRRMSRKYESMASVIWNSGEARKEHLASSETPLLISWPGRGENIEFRRSLRTLMRLHGDRSEEVLFRNPLHASAWKSFNNMPSGEWEFAESILIT
jgi:radical SAM superfamily enzyme YgiQ (UPF0313 family)